MTNPRHDRQIELDRYNQRAFALIQSGGHALGPDGADGIPTELRGPYLHYEAVIQEHVRPGLAVLDLCCGDGLHSLTAAKLGATVTVSDIAENNLLLAKLRAQRAGVFIRTVAANAERLPLPDGSFDVVTCAGSLSYLNLGELLVELRRLLRPGGAFIFVDSFNHNPVYRFNRWVHFVRGHRSRSTLERMPTLATLRTIRCVFPDLAVTYHGVFSFLAPVFRLLGRERAARWLDAMDEALPSLHRFAFKVTGIGHVAAR